MFAPGGEEVAQLALPYTLTMNEIGTGYVLGTDTNTETGVTRVNIFRLRRRPRGTGRG